jgi:hypothetical protein
MITIDKKDEDKLSNLCLSSNVLGIHVRTCFIDNERVYLKSEDLTIKDIYHRIYKHAYYKGVEDGKRIKAYEIRKSLNID